MERGSTNGTGSVSRTFRVERTILERLQQFANDRRININTLGNQIFRDFVEFYANAGKAGYVPVHRELIMRLVEGRSKKDLEDIGMQVSKNYFRDAVAMLGYEFNPSSLLTLFESWVRACGFAHTRKINRNVCSYYVQHDMGLSWSILVGSCIKEGFASMKENIEFEASDKSFTLKVDLSKV